MASQGDITLSWKGIDPEVAEQAQEEGLVPAAYVLKKLKITRRTLGRAIKSGEIEVAKQIGGVRFFDPDEFEDTALEESLKAADQKGFLIEYLLDALSTANAHIDELIKLSHKPAQDTIKHLTEENASLRGQIHESWKTQAEVQEMYGTMLRETLLAEVDAEKERAQTRMKEDAFKLLKDKLVPVMLDNMGSGKLLQSLTDDQIEAFIEAGAADPDQVIILKKELDKRRKAREKQAKKGDNPNGKKKSKTDAKDVRADSGK